MPMPTMNDNDRRNVLNLGGDIGEEYRKALIRQRIDEDRKKYMGDNQAKVLPEPTKDMELGDEARKGVTEMADQGKMAAQMLKSVDSGIKSLEGITKTIEGPPAEGEEERSFMDSVGTFLKELPGQVAGGAMDAVNSTIDTARDLGKAAGIPNYALQFKNEKGEVDLDILSPEEVEAKGGMSTGVLPEVEKATTVAGGFTRSIANFAAGFIPAAKGLKAAGMVSKIGTSMAAGAIADGVAMDPHQDRLATLLNEVPALKEVIPDFMADNDPANESAWEGRIKNVLEGVLVGGATEAAVSGATKMFKAYKAFKNAPVVPKTPTQIVQEIEAAGAAKASADDLINPVPVDLGPEELLSKTPEGKTFVNHARINTAEDVHKVMQNMADEIDNTAKLSNVESRAASVEEYTAIKDLLGREPQRPFTASEAIAARDIMTSSAYSLTKLAKAAADPMASPEILFQFRKAVEVHRAIQETVIAGRKATAQSLQSWNVSSKSSTARAKQINELLGGAGDDAKVMAKMIDDLADKGLEAVSKAVQASLGKKLGDSYYQVWINGLLSSPATHGANIVSNTGTALFSIPERYITAGFDAMRGAGGESIAAANGRAAGFFGGLSDGFKLMTGKVKNEALSAGSKLERPVDAISSAAWGKQPDSVIGKGLDYLGRAIGLPGWALEKGDTFFKGVGYRMKLQETAHLTAAREGLKGKAFRERVADILANPAEVMVDEATDFARYQTFTNQAGDIAGAVRKLTTAVPGGKFIVPFLRTPANILSYGFERTPLALAMGDVRAAIRKGGPEGAEALARISAGSLLMASVTPLVLDGKVTGAGPSDFNQKRALEETGWKPYSVKIEDNYISYERIEPLSTLIGYSADIGSIMGQMEEEDSGELVAAGLAAFARNLTNKTFLSGLTQLTDVVVSGSASQWENYASRMTAGFIQPVYSSAGRVASHSFDRTKRDYKGDDVNGFLRQTIDRAMSTIPGMGSDAPPLRDVWGNAQEYYNGVAPTLEAVSPIKIYKEDQDPVNKLIADNDIPLTLPSRNVLGVRLTNEEYSRYGELAGKMAKEKLDSLYNNGTFNKKTSGPDGTAALIVKRVLTKSREVASAKLVKEMPDLQSRIYDARQEAKAKMIGGK